jgi:tRNA (cytidine/uridine-2'-O-)-methyltransferase
LRLVLFTTGAAKPYLEHTFQESDVLLFGRESAGAPEAVHQAADVRLKVPMREGLRSLNVAMTVAMAAGEAMRQTGHSPDG